MTAVGVIPHHQVCVCGEPIRPCVDTLYPVMDYGCIGWVHDGTGQHSCRGRNGLAEPRAAPVPP